MPKMTDSLCKICSMLGIGQIYCHDPLQQLNEALSDHCLWVVILNALDLMVPLLERHLGFLGVALSLKVLIKRGTLPQSGSKHAEGMANICRKFGAYWSSLGLTMP